MEGDDPVVLLAHRFELIASFLEETAALCDRVAQEQGQRDSEWLCDASKEMTQRAEYWRKQIVTLTTNTREPKRQTEG